MLLGQFTYATVPEPGPYSDADGWKVQQVLAQGDVRNWVENATGALGSFLPESVPLLATDAQLDALPRRLRLQVYPDGYSVLLHQVSAGQSHRHRDASFTHALLVGVSAGQGIGEIRPADLWDSPLWLRPVGAEQVSAARLDRVLPPVLPGPDVDGVWLDEPELALLLLAVLGGGLAGQVPGRVALVDPTGGLTAGWVAFLSRYLTPGAAWTALPFSTHERSVEANLAQLRELRVVGIPPEEADGARRVLGEEWVVLDPTQPPALLDGTWTFDRGRVVRLGPWAQLAESLSALPMLDLPSGPELLADATPGWAGSADDQPRWALPAALLTGPDEVLSAMREVARSAADLAALTWPAAVHMLAGQQQALIASFTRFADDPTAAFSAILRSADRSGTPAGAVDVLLDGYLRAMWEPSRTAWTGDSGPLPWLPQHIVPGPQLSALLVSDLPGLLGWSWRDEATPTQRVRLLSGVVSLGFRWSWSDRSELREPVRTLLEAMTGTLLVGRGPVDGSWPSLPPLLLARVVATVTELLRRDPGALRLPPSALRWLDRELGPLDVHRPLHAWTLLDLERAAAVDPRDPEAGAAGAAAVLRQALGQPEWPAAGWLDALHRGGVRIGPPALREVIEAAWTMRCPIPALGMGELYLARQPLGGADHDFAVWLQQAAGAAADPSRPTRSVSLHADCGPQPPSPGRLMGIPAFAEEVRTLARVGLSAGGPLRDSAESRLAVDLLAVDARDAADTDWARLLGRADVGSALRPRWPVAYQQLSRTTPAGRRALASSWLARALLHNEADLAVGALRHGHQDPVGRVLCHRPDPQTEDWQVEAWVRELLQDCDRAARVQWVAGVRSEASAAAELLFRRIRVRSIDQAGFRENLMAMVDDNAAKLALGTIGSMFNRQRR